METINKADARALAAAVHMLEHPGLMVRLAGVVGTPIERGFELLPSDWRERISQATTGALKRSLAVAVRSLGRGTENIEVSNWWHKAVVTASGAASGALGLAALVLELPVSTTVMLRSIAGIARSEGQDIDDMETRLECLQVLAFGGEQGGKAEAAENGYWAVRTAMTRAVQEAASFIAERGCVEEGAPPLLRLIAAVASRFGVVVSEEAAAKAIPIVGAFGGAAVNYLFLDHFQNMARGHFTVRRLEQKYGAGMVRREYERLVSMAA
jgi:hypothetical protein